ncbi:MAG: F0F1 ATP synthase subunit B [Gammaproteobacteria bacterium]
MDINLTLLGQMLTFVVFVWFTMKFVWPPIMKTMREREKKIADGLAAGERGERDLELARHKSIEIIQDAKIEAGRILDQANQRGDSIAAEAKEQGQAERHRLIAHAQQEIELQANQTKRELQQQVADLALSMAEKIVQRDIDQNVHRKWLTKAIAETQL